LLNKLIMDFEAVASTSVSQSEVFAKHAEEIAKQYQKVTKEPYGI